MNEDEEDEIRDIINTWLDANMEIFGEILEEWEENEYVQPYSYSKTQFKCNDCAKCCNFNLSNHWVWIYPYDMVKWLQKLDDEEYSPLFLSAIFPVEDLDGISGYGLPSQKEISIRYEEMIRENKKFPIVQKTLQAILRNLKRLNPDFDPTSNYCIYYTPNPKYNSGHCLIYKNRPIQCQAYPFDYPQFTKFVIPGYKEEIQDEELPLCPSSTYIGGDPKDKVKISEDSIENVIIEKANYKTSVVIEDWSKKSEEWKKIKDLDLCDLFLQYFHKDILALERKTKYIKDKNQKSAKYMAGKRPARKKR